MWNSEQVQRVNYIWVAGCKANCNQYTTSAVQIVQNCYFQWISFSPELKNNSELRNQALLKHFERSHILIKEWGNYQSQEQRRKRF